MGALLGGYLEGLPDLVSILVGLGLQDITANKGNRFRV